LELLKAYISELDWPVKKGVKAMGIYEHEKEMVFVSMDVRLTRTVQMSITSFQLEKYRSIDSSILSAKPLTAAQLQKLGERLMSLQRTCKNDFNISMDMWLLHKRASAKEECEVSSSYAHRRSRQR